jgi:hypothetical protein
MTLDENEGARRCGRCGQWMRCELVRSHYRGWLYTGTTYHHACTGCGLRIRTVSTWKATIDLGAASLMSVICLGLGASSLVQTISRALAGVPMRALPWALPAGAFVMGAIFVGFGAWASLGVVNRRRHPLVR